MGRGVEPWFHGLASRHMERASCPAAHPSSAWLATKSISWRKSSTPTPLPKPRPSAAGSSYGAAAPTARPTTKRPMSSVATPAPSANGDNASPASASTAWPPARAAALRGLFPPEDRHKVIVLATTKPADLGLPFSHWSLEDLAIQIINDAHYRDMSRSTIQRIL